MLCVLGPRGSVGAEQPAGAGCAARVDDMQRRSPSCLSPSDIHILLVDDEKLSRIVVGNLLRKCSYKVTAAESGSEALEILRKSAPGTFQLVLTDVMMPEVDGLALLRFVRSNEAWKDLPVVMMSANEHKDTVFECIKGGAEEYLVKPVTKKEVQNIWQHVWRRLSLSQQVPLSEADLPSTSAALMQQLHMDEDAAALRDTALPEEAGNSARPWSEARAAAHDTVAPSATGSLPARDATACLVYSKQQPQLGAAPESVKRAKAGQHSKRSKPDRVPLSKWVLRPNRVIDRKESAVIFCEVLLLLEARHKQCPATPAGLRPSRLLLHSNGRVTLAATPAPSTGALDKTQALERQLYHSPEEARGEAPTTASDVFSLGILFFELFFPVTDANRSVLLTEVHQRILPSDWLLSQPKEAAFAMTLLHPDPRGRPSVDKLIRSDLFRSMCESLRQRRAALQEQEQILDNEVLVDFLKLMQQKKVQEISCMEVELSALGTDIVQVSHELHQHASEDAGEREAVDDGPSGSDSDTKKRKRTEPPAAVLAPSEAVKNKWQRVINIFPQLEEAFFKKKRKCKPASLCQPVAKAKAAQPAESAVVSQPDGPVGCLFDFADDLSRFVKYEQFEVKASLRYGDLQNSTNMVCSTAFDRDDEFFATAGVSKRVKIFEYAGVVDSDVGVHYPVLEITSRSRLSNACWSSYVKSHLVCADYEGVLQLWDTNTNTELMQFEEHAKRVWSVDFSRVDPTRIVSGSDDGTVRLWSINQDCSVATIESKANVCSVQFSPESSNLIAFGSANYRIYLYDLRRVDQPLATIPGHNKPVSYVRFLSGNQLVSASTDNTLKLWELGGMPANVGADCDLTFTGHKNEKCFVGLSVTRDGYIACGSENNSVFCYYKALPMPMASYSFVGSDGGAGALEELVERDQFVSSVCWNHRNDVLLAANSTGNIRVLSLN